jgi:hypothetical protein
MNGAARQLKCPACPDKVHVEARVGGPGAVKDMSVRDMLQAVADLEPAIEAIKKADIGAILKDAAEILIPESASVHYVGIDADLRGQAESGIVEDKAGPHGTDKTCFMLTVEGSGRRVELRGHPPSRR